MKRTIVFLASTPFLLGACGVAMTQGPPAGHESMPSFQCTTDRTGPRVDLALVAFNLLVLIGGAQEGSLEYVISSGNQTAFGIAAVIFAISAGVGFDKVSRCVAAKRDLAERQAERAAARGRALDRIAVQKVMISGDEITDGDFGVGGKLGVRVPCGSSVGVRFEAGYRRWLDTENNEITLGVGVGGIVHSSK